MTTKNVLIVEDDSKIASIVAKVIDKFEEFEVVAIASTASDAIEVLNCLTPDLVFLDISLVKSSGLEVIEYIRQDLKDAQIDIVMLTAAKEVDILQKSISFGVFDYILKPIAFSRLNQSLQRYLEYTHKLENKDDLEQEDFDLFFGKAAGELKPKRSDVPPKGVDNITLDKVRAVISSNPDTAYTAEAMSECIGTSRTTARRYLEYLLSNNEVRADIEYGSVGRPERRYAFLAQEDR